MKTVVLLAVLLIGALSQSVFGAILSLEWAGQPGIAEHTMLVDEAATIYVRLDILSGESFGWAETPLAVGTFYNPDNTPQFEITALAPDGFIGPGFTYDRSGMPPLPCSPEDYWLSTQWDEITPIVGPATFYLDAMEIVALAVGQDEIVLGETVVMGSPPSSTLIGADGTPWEYLDPHYTPTPGYWQYGLAYPGRTPMCKCNAWVPRPLILDVVPEPSTATVLGLGILLLYTQRQWRR